jgi:UDP-N-acetylglucosamine:LPS N-acetylglucosamine transferase
LAAPPPRVLIYSASIGEGHDGPARQLAAGIVEARPGAEVEIADFLALTPVVRTIAMRGSSFHSRIGSLAFDAIFWLATYFPPTRWLIDHGTVALTARRLLRRVAASRPDVVVATYPGAAIVLGALRSRGRLPRPTVSAITDLAALRVWARPGIDIHLITHPESAAEVRELAPASEITCVRGLTSPGFEREAEPAQARRDLGLDLERPVVVVSGGGWAVGDLEGAVGVAVARSDASVICLCGRNEQVRERIASRYAGEGRVRVLGFTERISELFAAADVVIHSTAGLTVLEALMRGCRVISYGWGHGHIRVNNRAFVRFGLADVAGDPAELGAALDRALAAPRLPDHSFAELPDAGAVVAALAG